MIGSILIWCALLLGSWALYIVSQTPPALLPALTVTAAPVLSAGVAALMRKKVYFTLQTPSDTQSGEAAAVTFLAENRSNFPAPQLRLKVLFENELTGERLQKSVFMQAGRRASGQTAVAFCGRFCGSIRVTIVRAQVLDMFGIFPFPAGHGDPEQFLVLPETFEPEINLPLYMGQSDESDLYSTLRPGYDYTEPFQLRPYVPGDSQKQVHWKLTCKYDELIVRDPGLPIERTVLLLWDRAPRAETPAQADAQVRALVSVCITLLQQGVICRLAWNDAQTNSCMRYELRQDNEIYALMAKLLQARASASQTDGVEQYLRLYGAETGCKVLYLSAQPSPLLPELCPEDHLVSFLCTGEQTEAYGRVYRIDPQDCAQSLVQIDLC